jgi:hypothetical protein
MLKYLLTEDKIAPPESHETFLSGKKSKKSERLLAYVERDA